MQFPIHECQHGYSTDKSTESAISDTGGFIEMNRTGKRGVFAVSLDIQAAFDSVTPNSIKAALIKHGSNKEYANWYHNFLTHRDLETELKGETYSASNGLGFPQGGVVSADFWKIVFDPAIHIINNENTQGTGYADDLILLRAGYSCVAS